MIPSSSPGWAGAYVSDIPLHMRLLLLFATLFIFARCSMPISQTPSSPIAIALHGGASNIKNMHLTPEQEAAYLEALNTALDTGYQILQRGGTSLEATTQVVVWMENCPLFNAGKGAVLSHDGTIQMDAAIMDGATMHCGAVAGVSHIKNPILAARKVMEKSGAVMLSEEGAEDFARKEGIEMADDQYFITPFRREQWERVRHRDTTVLDNDTRGEVEPVDELKNEKYGTVGCVALDRYGNLAAATSTGGLVNKKYHRIGDSPIIGAGTYADNRSCAVSCTGKGEDFIRFVAAHEIASLVRYKKLPVSPAAKAVLNEIKKYGGRGGCIAVDRAGNVATRFTTSGMFRARIDGKGKRKVAIYQR